MGGSSSDEGTKIGCVSKPLARAACEGWLRDHTPDQPPIRIELRLGERPMIIETVDGTVRVRPGSVEHPDAQIIGTPRIVLSVLAGKLDLAQARAAGLCYEGDPEILRRVQPLSTTIKFH